MNVKRPIAALLLATTTAGCMAAHPVVPEKYFPANHPDQMLLLDDAGTIHLLDQPTMVADTVRGLEVGTEDTLALPVSQVRQAMVREKSVGKTVLLVGGLTALTSLAVVGIAIEGSKNPCVTGANKKDNASPTGTSQCSLTLPDGTN